MGETSIDADTKRMISGKLWCYNRARESNFSWEESEKKIEMNLKVN